jgi:hypothetical protein
MKISPNNIQMASKSLIYYPYGNTEIIHGEIQTYQEGFDSRGYTQISSPNSAGNVISKQVQPLQQISADYSVMMNTMNQNYTDLSNNIGIYNDTRNSLLANNKYEFDSSIPVNVENPTLSDGLNKDTQLMALGQNNFYIAGTILSATLLITGIYLGM